MQLVRVMLNLVVIVIGVGLMATARFAVLSTYAQLAASVGLVLIVSSLMMPGLHVWEAGVRVAALLAGIAASVATTDAASLGGVLAVTLVLGVIAAWLTVKGKWVNATISFAFSALIAISYWLLAFGVNTASYQALTQTLVAGLCVAYFVMHQHIDDSKQSRQLTENAAAMRLAAKKDEVKTENKTYAFFVQPMVDVTSSKRRLMAYELLLRVYDYANDRWTVPKSFDVSIGKQIDLIEKVLENVDEPRVALNMSAEDFVDENTMHRLTDFARTSDKLKGLIIELTHAPTLEEMQRVAPKYHDADIRIAIDDVGSDNHFEGLQGIMPYIDGVKFGMQNLRRYNDTANLSDRMHFWYDLAAEYDIDFIMEGIENKDDEKFAKEKLRVQYLQGYYYGRPQLPTK